jgi:hypothetical protein
VAELPGLELPSSLDLATGLVARSEIGACVQITGYELSRLMTGVEYREKANGGKELYEIG